MSRNSKRDNSKSMFGKRYVPVTPSGTPLPHIAANTEQDAWRNLLRDAAHMPYKDKLAFQKRGYTVEVWPAELT